MKPRVLLADPQATSNQDTAFLNADAGLWVLVAGNIFNSWERLYMWKYAPSSPPLMIGIHNTNVEQAQYVWTVPNDTHNRDRYKDTKWHKVANQLGIIVK